MKSGLLYIYMICNISFNTLHLICYIILQRNEVEEPDLVRVKRQKRDLTEQLDEALLRVKRNKRDVSEQALLKVKRGDIDRSDLELTRVCDSITSQRMYDSVRYK